MRLYCLLQPPLARRNYAALAEPITYTFMAQGPITGWAASRSAGWFAGLAPFTVGRVRRREGNRIEPTLASRSRGDQQPLQMLSCVRSSCLWTWRSKSVVPEAWGTPGFGRVFPDGAKWSEFSGYLRVAGRRRGEASIPTALLGPGREPEAHGDKEHCRWRWSDHDL